MTISICPFSNMATLSSGTVLVVQVSGKLARICGWVCMCVCIAATVSEEAKVGFVVLDLMFFKYLGNETAFW